METVGIVEAADEAGLPWVAVRAIVDSAMDTLPPACPRLSVRMAVAMGRLLRMICRSPLVLRHIVRLAGDTALLVGISPEPSNGGLRAGLAMPQSRDKAPMKTLVTGGTGFVGAMWCGRS
jgi:hypothetical protein